MMHYEHISQKPYCCVPTCLQMIFQRCGLPLLTQSDIGYELGMILPPEKRHTLGLKSYEGEKPRAGWGTRMNFPEFSLGQFLKRRNIPLTETYYTKDALSSQRELQRLLTDNLEKDNDALVCFNYPLLYGEEGSYGHASLVADIDDTSVTLIDPEKEYPKPRVVELEKFYESIVKHSGGGVWVISEREE